MSTNAMVPIWGALFAAMTYKRGPSAILDYSIVSAATIGAFALWLAAAMKGGVDRISLRLIQTALTLAMLGCQLIPSANGDFAFHYQVTGVGTGSPLAALALWAGWLGGDDGLRRAQHCFILLAIVPLIGMRSGSEFQEVMLVVCSITFLLVMMAWTVILAGRLEAAKEQGI